MRDLISMRHLIYGYEAALIILGLAALIGGGVMWRRSGRAGWAPVIMLFGLVPFWGPAFAHVFSPFLNARLNAQVCNAAGCAPHHWAVWHLVQAWGMLTSLPRWVGLAYGLVLLCRELRRGPALPSAVTR